MRKLLVVAAVAALALTGCGSLDSSGPSASGGSIAQAAALKGQAYTVGGKEFDEQKVLCQLTIAALQAAGATANDKCGIVGSVPTREALTSSAIDLYWEYTGTAWTTYQGQTDPIPDAQKQYDAVKTADAKNGVVWLDRAPFNNTYAIGVTKALSDQLNVRSLSDLAKLANSGSPDATMCIAQEFAGRNDGLPGLEKDYGFTAKTTTIDEGAIYQAVHDRRQCNFGEIATTDGRIQPLGLVALDDDKQFFPLYNGALTVRQQAYDKAPAIAQVFAPITAKLTNDVMIELNKQVSQDGRNAADVARDWLKQQGFIG
jgi:osmoprotectant transport system substrate-binding protein